MAAWRRDPIVRQARHAMRIIHKDLLLGILFTVLFSLCAFVFVPFAVEVMDPQGVTPATWPKFVSLFIAVMALILAVTSYAASQKAPQTERPSTEKIDWVKLGLTIACLISFYFLVAWLGIVLASTIVFVVFSRICGKIDWRLTLVLAVVIPIVLYFFFTRLAHVPMPLGIFYDLV